MGSSSFEDLDEGEERGRVSGVMSARGLSDLFVIVVFSFSILPWPSSTFDRFERVGLAFGLALGLNLGLFSAFPFLPSSTSLPLTFSFEGRFVEMGDPLSSLSSCFFDRDGVFGVFDLDLLALRLSLGDTERALGAGVSAVVVMACSMTHSYEP